MDGMQPIETKCTLTLTPQFRSRKGGQRAKGPDGQRKPCQDIVSSGLQLLEVVKVGQLMNKSMDESNV